MLAVLLFTSPALADSIPVPDYDFSSPTAPTTSPYAVSSSSAGLGSWQVSPPPSYWTSEGASATQWYDSTGAFYNIPAEHISGLPGAGTQVGYMFDNPGLQLSQTLSSTFQVGQSYQLTVGIGGGSNEFGSMAAGTQMQIGLFYLDGSGNENLIGTTTATWDGSTLPDGYVTSLTDYSVSIPAVNATDAWAGQNIGVALIQPYSVTAPAGDGSYWDVGNVRLVTPAPEPGSLVLLAAGLGAFVLGRKWSSKGGR
jgi:hypothetical protein